MNAAFISVDKQSTTRLRRILTFLFASGIVAFSLLCAFSLLYYKECRVLPDASNCVFELVTNGGHFAVFHRRFIAVPTQLLPWLAVRQGQPLEMITWLYSLNIILFYALWYLVIGLLLRNYKAAIAFLIFFLLLSTHTFYWAVSELTQAVALLFAAIALIAKEPGEKRMNDLPLYSLLAPIMITVACTHGLAIFPVSFILLFFWLRQPGNRRPVLITGMLYGVGAVFKLFFLNDEYDRHALGGLRNIFRLFPDYFSTESLKYFLKCCVGPYCWVPIVFIVNCSYYISRKAWLNLGLMFVYSIGYLLFTTTVFPKVEGNGLYNENLFLLLGVPLAIPFVYDVLSGSRKPVLAAALTLVLIAGGLVRIWYYHKPYSARLAWQRGLISRYEGRKVILPESAFAKDTLLMAWSSPYEFWLLSTIERKRTASIIIASDTGKFLLQSAGNRQLFLTTFGAYSYSNMSPLYFMFRDTTNVYEVDKVGY